MIVCPDVPITDQRYYLHTAARLAKETENAIYTNQHDNLANQHAHYTGTGPEIWRQTGNQLDVFLAASGSGGTLCGCSKYLKKQNEELKVYVVDPAGSGLYEYVKTGQVKGRESNHGRESIMLETRPGKTIAEGVGNNKLTRNFDREDVDGAIHVTDIEAVEMAYYL